MTARDVTTAGSRAVIDRPYRSINFTDPPQGKVQYTPTVRQSRLVPPHKFDKTVFVDRRLLYTRNRTSARGLSMACGLIAQKVTPDPCRLLYC